VSYSLCEHLMITVGTTKLSTLLCMSGTTFCIFGRPFVHQVCSMLSDCCLSVLSVSGVGVLWPNGWMDQDETWCGGRSRPRPPATLC